MRRQVWAFPLLLFWGPSVVAIERAHSSIAETYESEKAKMLAADTKSRQIMGALYEINNRMKGLSKRRDILNNRVLGAEGNVKNLARAATDLEQQIQVQRQHLSKRLRAIYMLGGDSVARVIFSSVSSQDLNRSLRYLKIISDHDYKQIKAFEKKLSSLNAKRLRLKKEVKKLLVFKERLQRQEQLLARDQGEKSKLLEGLKSDRAKRMQNIENLRKLARVSQTYDLLDLSFFEHKGKLSRPIEAVLRHGYGLIENEDFRYRLSHKGHHYITKKDAEVKSIFNGQVSFVGDVEGYGRTIIVDHGDHYYSVYARLGRSLVQEGQAVNQSEVIARALENLYFEIRHFSDAVDPQQWIADNSERIETKK